MANPTSNTQRPYTATSNDDLYEHHRVITDKGQQPLRIDKFLIDRLPNTSRNKIQNATIAGTILVNDKAVRSSYKVKPGDVISIVLPYPPREIEIIPEDIPLNIVYEDDELIIINKQANLVVHPGYGNYSGTLLNALAYHLAAPPRPVRLSSPKSSPSVMGSGGMAAEGAAGLVHRLDKNTTGLMVIAKNELALTKLAKQFFDRTIDRTYISLVWGDLEGEGTITQHIGRNLKNRKVMAVFPGGDHGKHAVTHYKVLERFGYVTLVECKLETGRTHQIRIHFKYIGHPLFNDGEYGGNKILKGRASGKYNQFIRDCFKILPRQALHAKSLGFTHPSTGEHIFFESELPKDLIEVVEKWRKYAGDKKEN
ncbi:RluA family pseudouridine synthase [bacterium AH-315-M05]|nr:RluA family pseudouridine synthase [bacterium AH-315-M05]